MLRLEVDVGSEVDVTLVQLSFHLHKGGTLVIELVLSIINQPISYLLHSFFVRKGIKT